MGEAPISHSTYVLFLVGCPEVKILYLGVDEFEILAKLVIVLGLWLALCWVLVRGVCFGESGGHLTF